MNNELTKVDNSALALANFRKTYSDGYEFLRKTWSPSTLPDYGHSQFKPQFIAKDNQLLAFFEQLKTNYKVRQAGLELEVLPESLSTRITPSPTDSSCTLIDEAPIASVPTVTEVDYAHSSTVWTNFSGWIENAIRNENPNAPVRGGLHPRQTCLHVLNRDRRFGYVNKFALEDELYPAVRSVTGKKRRRNRTRTKDNAAGYTDRDRRMEH